jgi:hypothetical protein
MPWPRPPESNAIGSPVFEVTVCWKPSWFVQRTSSPTCTVTVAGEKAEPAIVTGWLTGGVVDDDELLDDELEEGGVVVVELEDAGGADVVEEGGALVDGWLEAPAALVGVEGDVPRP